MIQLYYSSGKPDNAIFKRDISQSVGGKATTILLKNSLNNLFGTISQNMLNRTSIEYRCIYLKNSSLTKEIKNITLSIDEVISQPFPQCLNPDLLNPAPTVNQKYIVPINSVGDWENKDNYIATWNGISWDFEIDKMTSYKFAVDESEQTINDVFTQPFGIDFITAENFKIDSIAANGIVQLWIERTVKKRIITKQDFDFLQVEINKGISFNETRKIIFTAVEKNSFKTVYNWATTFVKDDLNNLNFAVKINELGEENYTNLAFQLIVKFNTGILPEKLTANAIFDNAQIDNVQNLNSFFDFASTNDLNEPINLICTFLDSGIYQLTINLVDLSNENNIIATNNFNYTVTE